MTRPSSIQTGDVSAIDVHVHLEAPADAFAADAAARTYFGESGAAAMPPGSPSTTGRGASPSSSSRWTNVCPGGPSSRTTKSPISPPRTQTSPWRSRASIRNGAPTASARRAGSSRPGRVRGLKLHPPLQQFEPNDRLAYPLYEVFAEAHLPVLFHTGHSGIGTGMPGGGGIRLKYGNPMPIDDVAVDFPDMPIIMAHPSFPWQDEAISICLHKPTVYIDLSGWSPKYFSPTLVQYANTLLKHKMLFGSDYPWITPDRWLADLEKTAIREDVRPLILKENAIRLFGLGA